MHRHLFSRRAVFGAVAAVSVLALVPAQAQTPGSVVAAAAVPVASSAAIAPRPAACVLAADQARFDFALPRTARRLASGEPIKIVALGSSSTYGAGASTSAAAYPSRLAIMRHWSDTGDFDLYAAGRDNVLAHRVHDCIGRGIASMIIDAAHLLKPGQ
jgi:hypothetical protein